MVVSFHVGVDRGRLFFQERAQCIVFIENLLEKVPVINLPGLFYYGFYVQHLLGEKTLRTVFKNTAGSRKSTWDSMHGVCLGWSLREIWGFRAEWEGKRGDFGSKGGVVI